MKTFVTLGVTASLASLSLASSTSHSPLNALRTKRALMTCVETYGGGSITCGAAGSPYCYDPTLGETCCEMDNGYCKAGDFCAPVAGFCCTIGEDPETCAERLAFTLPASFSVALPTGTSAISISASTSSVVVAEITASGAQEPVTTTVHIAIASVLLEEKSTTTVPSAASTIDTNEMTPQFTAPVGNKMTPEYTAPVNTTVSAAATKTASGNVLEYTGAAVVGKGINEMGSLLGLVAAFAGLVL